MHNLQHTIDAAWEQRAELSPDLVADRRVRDAVASVIGELDAGRLRVAEKTGAGWITHQWLKKAVLLSFRLADNVPDRARVAQRAVSLLRQGRDQVRAVRRRGVRARRASASCRRPWRGAARTSRRTSC